MYKKLLKKIEENELLNFEDYEGENNYIIFSVTYPCLKNFYIGITTNLKKRMDNIKLIENGSLLASFVKENDPKKLKAGLLKICEYTTHEEALRLKQLFIDELDPDLNERNSLLEKDERKEYFKNYYSDNVREITEYKKAYHKLNSKKIIERSREYYQNNREHCLLVQKQYHENRKEERKIYLKNNKDKVSKHNKTYREKMTDEDREKRKEYMAEYHEKNKEHIRLIKTEYQRKYRARKKAEKEAAGAV